jgi:hypothetical protein
MMQAQPQRAHPTQILLALVVGLGILFGAIGIAWFATPEAQPFILLGGFAVNAIVTIVGYAVQRRRHW